MKVPILKALYFIEALGKGMPVAIFDTRKLDPSCFSLSLFFVLKDYQFSLPRLSVFMKEPSPNSVE